MKKSNLLNTIPFLLLIAFLLNPMNAALATETPTETPAKVEASDEKGTDEKGSDEKSEEAADGKEKATKGKKKEEEEPECD